MTLVVISFAVALSLIACGGNQAGYDIPAVDGTFGDAGNTIALRDVLIPSPRTPQGAYPAGSTVPVFLAIVNHGNQVDKLIAVTSPEASQVQMIGVTDIPPGGTVVSTASSAAVNTPPASPLVAGRLQILLTLNQVLRDGLNIPVTFQFQHAGMVTLQCPREPARTSSTAVSTGGDDVG